jgi:hypothetical protein
VIEKKEKLNEKVILDKYGNIFIADTYNLRIREVAAVTGTQYGISMTAGNIYTVAGNGTPGLNDMGGYTGDGGPATSAELAQPISVAVDAAGNIYIAGINDPHIRRVDTAGIITTVAGNGTTIASGQKSATFTVGQQSYTLGEQSFSMDTPPFIKNGRLLVPVRFLADALGAQTKWDPAAQEVTISRSIMGFTTLQLNIGSTAMVSTSGYGNTAYGSTYKTIRMDVTPMIVNSRAYIPARYVAEAFGFNVSWDAVRQQISVSQQST